MNTQPEALRLTDSDDLTVRDYFAAKALQAVIQRDAEDTTNRIGILKARAYIAYTYADAMLEERKSN